MIIEINPNSVEEWAKEFEKFKPVTLTEEQSHILFTLAIYKDKIEEELSDESSNDIVQVIYKISKSHIKLGKAAAFFISLIVSNFGEIRLILAFIQYKAWKHKVDEISIGFLCRYVFPYGFPTHEFMHEMWLKQKYNPHRNLASDNMLDYSEAYKSLR